MTAEPLTATSANPPDNCADCPRLADYRASWRVREPDWHNAPVKTWMPEEGADPVRLLIVGLAPGLRGANRTGQAFTGDASGTALFAAMTRYKLASYKDDALVLNRTAITNAVRCVPPENRPTGAEIANCRPYLKAAIAQLPKLKLVLSLGSIAHRSVISALGARQADHPFAHGAQTNLAGLDLVASYHCSRYNMNTGRLTQKMLDSVIERIASAVQS